VPEKNFKDALLVHRSQQLGGLLGRGVELHQRARGLRHCPDRGEFPVGPAGHRRIV